MNPEDDYTRPPKRIKPSSEIPQLDRSDAWKGGEAISIADGGGKRDRRVDSSQPAQNYRGNGR